MHFLNNGKHALVFPPRCGTRWIASQLYDTNLLNTKAPNHEFIWQDNVDVKIFMFVRNPFERERSLHRWLSETKQKDITVFPFEEYVNSECFEIEPSWYTRYGNLNNNVQHIHLENIHNFFTEVLNLDIPQYYNSYHLADDNRDDLEIFDNPNIVNKILDKYKEDIEHIQFDLTKYI